MNNLKGKRYLIEGFGISREQEIEHVSILINFAVDYFFGMIFHDAFC